MSSKQKSQLNEKRSTLDKGHYNVCEDEVPPTENCDFEEAGISDDEEGGTQIGGIYIPPPLPPYCSTLSKGPRLIISRIENKNFKSYAGTVVLGPFHHCFSAIIGPNGSGKSNVIDSMLFVFGYRANKIRCKNMSTLIHNSAQFPNMSMCSVAVHFCEVIDKEDGSCETVPNSEIVVQRTAFPDNSSFYTINGKRTQFKEVAKLLKKHNVDLDHNRFLILQGEVESIAMMKPKGQTENECGLLEYLEDIVGTTRYKEPLVKINDRVEELTEECTGKHNRCKLAEREMRDLEQPFNAAVDYLKKLNENTRTKNLHSQKNVSKNNKKLDAYKKEHQETEFKLRQHDLYAVALEKERKDKEQLVQHETQLFDNLCKAKERVEKLWEETNRNFTEIQQTMENANKRRKLNKVQLGKLKEECIELQKIPGKNKNEVTECENKVKVLTKEKKRLEEELSRYYLLLGEQSKPLIEKRDKLQTEMIELKNRVDAEKQSLALSELKLKILNNDEVTEARKYDRIKTSYDESVKSLEEKRRSLADMNKLMPVIRKEIASKTTQIEKFQKEEQEKRSTLLDIKAEIIEKTDNLQMTGSKNKVLDLLMRLKSEGEISGILGRLGDLGGIDSKYDVAISTACGRLENVVVDTVDTVEKCVNKLKLFDVGRATFIALEKVKHFKEQLGPIHTPENAPRLFDLVRVEDERVSAAFYFALRNTLVAKDFEQGTRIAYGPPCYRVVTLNGDLIETSGTMSGGGHAQIRGKMGTSVQTKSKQSTYSFFASRKVLKDLQVQAEQLQSQINGIQQQQGRLDKDLHQLKVKELKIKSDSQKVEITIEILEEQLPHTWEQIEAQRKRIESSGADKAMVKSMAAEIKSKKEELQVAEDAAHKLQNKISQVQDQIGGAHGDKIKSVKSKINALGTQIVHLNKNILKLQVKATTSERNLSKVEKQIADLNDDIVKAQNEILAISAKRKEYDDETANLVKAMEEAQSNIDYAKGESSEVRKAIAALVKREEESNLKRIEIEMKLQTLTSKICDMKAQLPQWQEQLQSLKLHEIPGEEPPPPLKTYTEVELAAYTLKDIQYKETLEEEKLKEKPNLSCIEGFIEKRQLYRERVKILEDLTSKRNELRQVYDDLRKKRHNEFMQGFKIITDKLKEMYQMITQGGDAELELVDSMDPFTEGVSFSVRPPKKTWNNISNLSGGEKTLSSLAFVFALHYYKPTPLYFMDEIDAALDFKNISIVAHYIKERTKNAQFIIISLRSNMFELADHVVGIYKVQDCTNSVTIKNQAASLHTLSQTQTQNQTISQAVAQDCDDTVVGMNEALLMQTQGQTQPTTVSPHAGTSVREHTESIKCQHKSDARLL